MPARETLIPAPGDMPCIEWKNTSVSMGSESEQVAPGSLPTGEDGRTLPKLSERAP